MGFFASIMKAGMKNKIDDNEFYDVTSSKVPLIPNKNYTDVFIDSCLDVKISFGSNRIIINAYVENASDANAISISFINMAERLKITVSSSEKSIRGYIRVVLPQLSKLKVCSKYADIQVKKAHTDILCINSFSGDVEVSIYLVENAEIFTGTGDVSLEIPNNIFYIKANSTYGEVIWNKIKSDKKAKRNISCLSKSGDIQIDAVDN